VEPFTRLTAIAAPLERADIDTDMLIPQRFLRKPLTVGYRNFLFYNDRFDASGKLTGEFILDREPYTRAKIIVCRRRFRHPRGHRVELRAFLREQRVSERIAAGGAA
jgi:3-isopropylmalate dehydratase small subunit